MGRFFIYAILYAYLLSGMAMALGIPRTTSPRLAAALQMNGFQGISNCNIWKKTIGAASLSVFLSNCIGVPQSLAKDALPSLDKCFNAIEKELNPREGESLLRIKNDIDAQNWDDLKGFTREYDAGFRGGVLKSAWKQFDGEKKKRGIEVSNSFTFDLIALNKAARNQDVDDANTRLEQVRNDLRDFLSLRE
mmetsp:Transcript_19238/g.32568  ORF Transcript_19238/g.32568 Transcript_19238/m.32568 type:complete len:192 (-) Transcript_19238:58-633(-)